MCANALRSSEHADELSISTNDRILPRKVDNIYQQMKTAFSHWSPYEFLAAVVVPNCVKATQQHGSQSNPGQ